MIGLERTQIAAGIVALAMALAMTMAAAPAPPLADRIDAYLRSMMDKGFAGAVLVARGEEIVLQRGYGVGDPDHDTAIGPESVFDIGSITKQLTAAAVLRLAADGALRLEDSLGAFFEGVPEDKRGITLHHLLTHDAGLENTYGRDYEPIDRDAYVRLVLDSPLAAAPGSGFDYCNSCYSLLAAVVERVSKRPFERFLYQTVLRPAGVEKTGYRRPAWPDAEVVRLSREQATYVNPLLRPGPSWHLVGNGGVLSTAGDLWRWVRALASGTALPPEAVARMTTGHVDWTGREGVRYGYGWEVAQTARGTKILRHSGGSGEGVNGMLRWLVDEDVVIVVLSHRLLDDGTPAIFSVPEAVEAIVFPAPEQP